MAKISINSLVSEKYISEFRLLALLLSVYVIFSNSHSSSLPIQFSVQRLTNSISFSSNANWNLTNANRNSLQFWRFSICFMAFIALYRIYRIQIVYMHMLFMYGTRNTTHGTRFHDLQYTKSIVYSVYRLPLPLSIFLIECYNKCNRKIGTMAKWKHET